MAEPAGFEVVLAACSIEVRGLRVLAAHGALAEERHRPQPFEIDLDVELDCAGASESDSLADAADYGPMVAVLVEAFGARPTTLLETLARRCARAVLDATPKAKAVSVLVRKVRPPLPADLAHVAVRVRVERRAL